MNPSELLPRFDTFLAWRGLALEAVVLGGAALALLGLIDRETRDFDLMDPELSPEVRAASVAFAVEVREQGGILRDDWLNNGPINLGPLLPEGWRDRLQLLHHGAAIRLWTLGRSDLLLSKLFALCDRGLDLGDCVALAPSAEELAEARPWLEGQDSHPGWTEHVRRTLEDLAGRLGHGV